ncbi:hypothetical protein BJ322DRAFT_1107339 [Thelephora terrestris]|uniref:Uncharacterized protein n=1 Tax=Thelephora terrestris TaxID=56493 RepID=A0A9P6HHS5_9AGAM|nr:hypothetical protein BJ322DRAFT_1107339 [Thelephora terrestris]
MPGSDHGYAASTTKGAGRALNVVIEAVDIAEQIANPTPAKTAFGSINAIFLICSLRTHANRLLTKAHRILPGIEGKTVGRAQIVGSRGKTIEQLSTTTEEIQRKIVKWGKRSVVTQLLHTKNHNLEKEAIDTWRSDLKKGLGVFETELEIEKLVPVSNTHQDAPDSRTSACIIHHDTSKAHHELNSGPPVSEVQHPYHHSWCRRSWHKEIRVRRLPNIALNLKNDGAALRDVLDTHVMLSDIHCGILEGGEWADGQRCSVSI